MYERILVPTDGSSGVERAVEHAVDLARTYGAELHVLNVVNVASLSAEVNSPTVVENFDASAVSGGRSAVLRYRPNVRLEGGEDESGVAGAYMHALRESEDTEARMRTTVVGPQRDGMVINLEGDGRELDVQNFGSGGRRSGG
jgi:nucleotide-binding universal stress UspA family protein